MSIQIPGSSSNINTHNDVKKTEKNDKSSEALAKADASSNMPNTELQLQDDVSTVTSLNKAESKIPDERLLENTSQAVEMAEKIKLAINANPYLALDAHGDANDASVNKLLSAVAS